MLMDDIPSTSASTNSPVVQLQDFKEGHDNPGLEQDASEFNNDVYSKALYYG